MGYVPERSLAWKHKTRTFMDHLCAKFFYTFNEFTTVNVALLCITCSSPKAKGTLVMEQH